MREIKREYTTTIYSILEFKEGKVEDIGEVVVEGDLDMVKARKIAMKQFPGRNICLGDTKTETAIYSMSAQEFIKTAHKQEI